MNMSLLMKKSPLGLTSYIDAIDLMICSVYKPDPQLRKEAKDMDCHDELLQIREEVLEYLQNIRNEASV